MESTKRSILLVEDAEGVHTLMQEVLPNILPEYALLSALTLAQGEQLFHAHAREIVAVLMDGCVDNISTRPDTLELIRSIRRSGWTGPLISITSIPAFWPAMQEAGCTDMWQKHKLLERLPLLLQT